MKVRTWLSQQVIEVAAFLRLLEIEVILLEALEHQICPVIDGYLKQLEEGALQCACRQNQMRADRSCSYTSCE